MLKKCLMLALALSLAGCGHGTGRTTGTPRAVRQRVR